MIDPVLLRGAPMRLALAVSLTVGLACQRSDGIRAADHPGGAVQSQTIPTPAQDDADLHDVWFLGRQLGWAVGDHNVLWRTANGRDWEFVPLACQEDWSLRSVCFLSDRVGWLAGGRTVPYTRLGVGIVLCTTDGGKTWTNVAKERLPRVHCIRCFSTQEAIAAVDATAEFSTGVVSTRDGGTTWQAVEGARHSGWRAADFRSIEIGLAVGMDGAAARVEGAVVDVRGGGFGSRGLYDVKLSRDDRGWIVGDGGLVLHTENRGVVWQAPPSPLPDGVNDLFDFRAVAVRGDKIWIAGKPGTVIWHSGDGGRSWQGQPTGQPAPIERLFFPTVTDGWSVGAFGSILHTGDGGITWQPQRAAGRRAAILSLATQASGVSFAMVAQQAGERGYRTVVSLPFRGEGEEPAKLDADRDLRLHDAVLAAGGARAEIGWRFPLEVPGLDRDRQKLIADWTRRTEGHLERMLMGTLVRQIRTWQPTVLILDQPNPADAAGRLLVQAVLESVRLAGDSSSFPSHRQIGSLRPWNTPRVLFRIPQSASADFVIAADAPLYRLHSTVMETAADAASRILPIRSSQASSEAFRNESRSDDAGASQRLGDFFAGLSLVPGSESRRQLPDIHFEYDESASRSAHKNAVYRQIAGQRAAAESGGGEMLANLSGIGSTTPFQLAALAESYRRNARWDLAEAVSAELIDRYPNEPIAQQSMQWLLQYWISSELTYQRNRPEVVERVRQQYHPERIQEVIQRAIARAQDTSSNREPGETILAPGAATTVNKSERVGLYAQGDMLDIKLRQQRELALKLALVIQKRSPPLFRSAEVQLPLAALLRQADPRSPSRAKLLSAVSALGTAVANTPPTAKCKRVPQRPHLDGILSDACWQEAEEIPLAADGTPSQGNPAHAFVLLAYDSEYLYFAISAPRVNGSSDGGAMSLGRHHDQDLSPYDRVAFYFDLDRDFVSSYRIEIDQRGCVADSCWNDARWNAQMWVAADTSELARWRVEGAIPLRELLPRPPRPGETWGLAAVRTIPAVHLESWSPPAASSPRPETFGLLRFQ